MVDRFAELASIQTEAIRELEIDKVVVYDSGNGQGVGNFVKGLYGMMPQLNDFLEQSGMSLPEALVKTLGEPGMPLEAGEEVEEEFVEGEV